jgi:hypothetical protein
MRKLLTLALLLFAFNFVPAAKAENVRTSAALNNPQIQVQIGRRRRRRNWNFAFGNRVGYGRTFTQDVRIGRRTYRETYQVINGRAVLISRVRLF